MSDMRAGLGCDNLALDSLASLLMSAVSSATHLVGMIVRSRISRQVHRVHDIFCAIIFEALSFRQASIGKLHYPSQVPRDRARRY